MARPLRIEYPGALYHVISRGNAYQNIYRSESDLKAFIYKLKDAIKSHNIICHAYCLMSNHYHLLIETPDANLSRAMRDINGNYTQWFNSKYRTVGHLFQGRYKAFVVEKETYLLQLARYIVLNPLRAKLVDHPRKYKWSSYRLTAEANKVPDWLHVDWILSFFGSDRKEAQKRFRSFVIDGVDTDDPHNEVQHGILLGSPQFVFWIWETQTNGREELKNHPREQRIVGRPTLDEIFEDVMTIDERNNAIRFAKIRCGYLNSEIAAHIKLHWTTVGKIARS